MSAISLERFRGIESEMKMKRGAFALVDKDEAPAKASRPGVVGDVLGRAQGANKTKNKSSSE